MADTKKTNAPADASGELEALKRMLAEQEARQKEQDAQMAELRKKLEAVTPESVDIAAEEAARKQKEKAEAEEREQYAKRLEEKVPVTLIKLPFSGYTDEVFLGINGETVRIKRGETVMVKRKFALLLDQSQMQNNRAIDYMEAEAARYANDENTRRA